MNRIRTYKEPRWHFWVFSVALPSAFFMLVGAASFLLAKWIFF